MLAVISGGSKGIGKAIALEFAKNGFDLAICARNESTLKKAQSELEKFNGKVLAISADVSQPNQIKQFATEIRKEWDDVDVLVNNAGVFIPGNIASEEEGVLQKQIETNLYSAYHLTRELLSQITEKGSYIFNVCSTASEIAYPNGGSYCISKFALLGFSKVLREELKPKGIRVSSVMPGATFTSSWEGVDLPQDRFIQPEDIASLIWTAYQLPIQTVMEEITIRPQPGDIV